MLLPLLELVLAGFIANLVVDVIATFVLILADVVPIVVVPLIHLLLKALLCW